LLSRNYATVCRQTLNSLNIGMAFLHYKFGYLESLDYSQLPGFESLSATKQSQVHEAFSAAYRSTIHLGMNIALGKAHENAKAALAEAQIPEAPVRQELPRSIFEGLDNCK